MDNLKKILNDPFAKSKIIEKIDEEIKSLYDEMSQNEEENISINIEIKGIDKLRYRVLKMMMKDFIGFEDEEIIKFIFVSGINNEISKMSRLKELVLDVTGIPTDEKV